MGQKNRHRWQGGPPDYMWWVVTVVQVLSILANQESQHQAEGRTETHL